MLDITFHLNDYETTYKFLQNLHIEHEPESMFCYLPNADVYLRYDEDNQTIEIYDTLKKTLGNSDDEVTDPNHETQALLTLNGHLSSILGSDDSEGRHIIKLKFLVEDEGKELSILHSHATVSVKPS